MLNREDLDEIATVSSYDEAGFYVNKTPIKGAIALSPHMPAQSWSRQSSGQLTIHDIDALLAISGAQVSIILIGTGATLCWPASDITQYCHNQNIGIEVMTTPSACRTYNVLASDGASLIAGLMPLSH